MPVLNARWVNGALEFFDRVTGKKVNVAGSGGLDYAKLSPNSRLVGTKVGFCGDSITFGAASSNAAVTSFRAMLTKLLGYRVALSSVNGGVSGERSDQLLARMDSIIAQGVKALVVLIGTNDASQSVTLATYQTNITAIKAKADAAGLPIMFCTVPPRGSSIGAGNLDLTNQYNAWLRFWCLINNIPLADVYAGLADTQTGYLSATYDSGDATHPNNAGHLKIAQVIQPVLDLMLPKIAWPVTAKGGGLCSNPLYDSGVAGGTGWTLTAGTNATGGGYTASTPGDLPNGIITMVRRIYDNSAGGSAINGTWALTIDTTKFAAGDVLLFAGYVRQNVTSGGCYLKLGSIASGSTLTSIPFESLPTNNTFIPFMFKVTAADTNLKFGFNFQANANSNVSVDFGATDVFNLTTLGMTSLVV
ncbi:SGNH/GDSL hydrolase family protein [Paenibacillus sedimenti]|uniref:SGNH/GDSL hydrolase family protein n=1 Tax=Paenibacillus sedimenti TaxID=2770274 RepID=A0A926KSL1_9BACL|nr:SGNH/GDSL hydrolase family protein [Paenibacillus sedimenti]MBD0381275.1 SGNH/GDSL hydrolase family protein [Paenibacillus sedimenti]